MANNIRNIKIKPFHSAQLSIARGISRNDRTVIRAGRRFGKTTALEECSTIWCAEGKKVGWFAPSYKLIIPTFARLLDNLAPIVRSSSKVDGLITTINGGVFEVWSLDNEDAGRSRSYDVAIIDEGSLKARGLRDVWEQAIKPTLLDRGGKAVMAGTPKGTDSENYFHEVCTNKDLGWVEYHAPTWANPTLNQAAVEALKLDNPPLVWQQEYAAEFVDWSGAAFFKLESMLENGFGVVPTKYPDYVFAVVDSAVKTGSKHDGTAVVYYAVSKFTGYKMVILDYDIVQIEGHLLEQWMPEVYRRLEEYGRELSARMGSLGVFFEDKASGAILLRQMQDRGFQAHAIDSVLTQLGKDERAISVSGYLHRGMIKLSKYAYDKVVVHKGQSKNHFVAQVCGYRIGVKDQADDLLDCATYGVAIALGNNEGI